METQSESQQLKYKHDLFSKYITPNLKYIKRLVSRYTYDKNNIDDYYLETLENFYKYIDTYNPEKPLDTWIHIVTRRFVQELVRKEEMKRNEDVDIEFFGGRELEDMEPTSSMVDPNDYREYVGDGLLKALDSIKPIYKEAFLLQMSGYTLVEMTEKLYAEGKLKHKNIETVKSRVFLAKTKIREMITRDGEPRSTH